MKDFNHVATHIVQESIASAIYIDDKVWLPYEERSNFDDHSELFRVFKTNNCILDINRYSREDSASYHKLLSSKDLLVLDWHLSEDETDLSSTFDIIDQAINSQNLHFCIIYTKQKKADLAEKIIFNIASYYSGLYKELCENVRNEFANYLDEQFGLDQTAIDSLIREIIVTGKGLFFDRDRDTIKTKLNEFKVRMNAIEKEFDLLTFLKTIQLPEQSYPKQLICLSFIFDKLEVPEVSRGNKVRIKTFNDQFSIQVNSLVIKAFDKDDITDAQLYNKFMDSVIHESNIFLTLLGLEIRSRFRETSGFIGHEFEDVDYLAFFQHRQRHFVDDDSGDINGELFNEFLKDIWRDQVSSFLLEKEFKLFEVIEDYKASKNIDSLLVDFKHGNSLHRESIAKLNWVYNRLSVNRKADDGIKFGDIFCFQHEGQDRYIICITPICDCLRPKKINNCYFFIEGKDIGVKNGVLKTDGDFISFIKKDNKPTCIDWASNKEGDCKPFTLYVPDNKLRGADRIIKFNFRGAEKTATYVCTIKENYVQRIANRAFFYPLRVGIDFASFPKVE